MCFWISFASRSRKELGNIEIRFAKAVMATLARQVREGLDLGAWRELVRVHRSGERWERWV